MVETAVSKHHAGKDHHDNTTRENEWARSVKILSTASATLILAIVHLH